MENKLHLVPMTTTQLLSAERAFQLVIDCGIAYPHDLGNIREIMDEIKVIALNQLIKENAEFTKTSQQGATHGS